MASRLLSGPSIEMAANDVAALTAARAHLPAGAPVSITYHLQQRVLLNGAKIVVFAD